MEVTRHLDAADHGHLVDDRLERLAGEAQEVGESEPGLAGDERVLPFVRGGAVIGEEAAAAVLRRDLPLGQVRDGVELVAGPRLAHVDLPVVARRSGHHQGRVAGVEGHGPVEASGELDEDEVVVVHGVGRRRIALGRLAPGAEDRRQERALGKGGAADPHRLDEFPPAQGAPGVIVDQAVRPAAGGFVGGELLAFGFPNHDGTFQCCTAARFMKQPWPTRIVWMTLDQAFARCCRDPCRGPPPGSSPAGRRRRAGTGRC